MILKSKYNFRIPGMIILISFLVFSFSNPAISQPYLVWERFNIAPNNGENFPVDLKIDSEGFIYNLCKEGGYSVYKYDQSGNLIWNTKYNHPGVRLNSTPKFFTINNHGDVYVTGDNVDEIITIKIDSSGTLNWVRTYIPASGFYSPGGIALDTTQNIVVVCGSLSNIERVIYAAIKYTSEGDTVWNKVHSDVSPVKGGVVRDIVISSKGEIYFSGALNIDSANTSQSKCYTVKINNDGKFVWMEKYYLQRSGLVYNFLDKNEEYVYTVGGVTNDGLGDVIILKYDSAGNMIWDVRYDTPEGYSEELRDAILDSDNNIIFTARSGTKLASIPFILTVKYNSTGSMDWERRFTDNRGHNNRPYGIISDYKNNIYITGQTNFLPNMIFIQTLKYTPNGDLEWNAINGTPNRINTGYKVIKAEDKLYVLGTMLWTNGMFNSILLKYSENPLSVNSNLENLNFNLFQNYPNPFNSQTKIKYNLPRRENKLEIKIYDIKGQEIMVMREYNKEAGSYEMNLDFSSQPSGVYYYSLIVNNERISTKKMVVLK